MMLPTLLAFTGLVTLASTTPVTPAIPQALPQVHPAPIHQRQSSNSTAPCAQVSQVIYSNPDRPSVTTVPAKLAYDCIKSVPFNASSAKRLLHDLPTYINWQSTLATLKNPPAEYAEKVQPPVDILGGLDKISSDIDAGKYKSEYDFGWDLYTLIQSAHDGHFAYIPDSVGEIFGWGRPIPLVSVSEDGSQLPAVFAYSDVLGMQFKNITYTPSAVTKINGADVFQYLETLSQYGSLQDRDALYNNLFYEVAQVSLGTSGTGTGMFSGGGRGRFVYPGPNTTLTFANGSDITVENYARVYTTFRNIQTGEDLAKTFSWGNTGSTGSTELQEPQGQPVAASVAAESAVTPGYPQPIVPGPGGIINGFYIDAEGYEDVAVLQVPNFVGSSFYEIDFQATSQKFIPQALADGKKKLIIDLQANGGGTILQGYDLFKQLFPSLDPYGANRFRYTEALDLIGQSYSAFASQFPRGTTKNSSIISIQASYFDYHNDMTVDAKPFGSWQEKVGPHEVNGDKFTTLSRWNLSDVYVTSSSGGINITGYGPLANVTGPPKFAPENVVLLTDGYCASTCTIFSELMTKQGGVKTIALGGRSNKNKIQAIGGVKGVNNYNYGYLQASAQNAIRIAPPELQSKLNGSVLRDYDSNVVFNRGASVGGVNVRDGLALNDTSGIALQFKYEEADCRLYYTPEMTIDATAIWKAAADAQWGSSGKCVGGGGYGEKRASDVVTTKLSPGRVQVSSAAALQKFEAFEKSFDLETDCQMEAPGFMKP